MLDYMFNHSNTPFDCVYSGVIETTVPVTTGVHFLQSSQSFGYTVLAPKAYTPEALFSVRFEPQSPCFMWWLPSSEPYSRRMHRRCSRLFTWVVPFTGPVSLPA